MKKSLLLMAMMSTSVFAGGVPTIVFEGVLDGPLPGGLPKMAEIYVIAGGEISNCGIGSATNGGASSGQDFQFTAGAVNSGDHLFIATEAPNFMAYLGLAPNFTDNVMSINGDDALELFCNGSLVDTYGVVGVDGTGEVWEHLDGWAHRNSIGGPGRGVLFNPALWTFSGINADDGCTDNATCGSVYPLSALPVELMNFSVE